jgi:acetylornithine deacetylase/succinyl-diaminopimelate desuccinylase-like protein
MTDARQAAYDAVGCAVARCEDGMVALLRDLVRVPSRTGEEGVAQELVANRPRQRGLTVDLRLPDANLLRADPDHVPTPYSYDRRPNVAGVWEGGGRGRSLILNGDIDVVGEGPRDQWFGFRCEPWHQDPNAAFVTALRESVSRALGGPVALIGRPAGCDSRFGTRFGVPSVTFGPCGDNAHAPDEWVDLPSVSRCALAVARAVIDWCGIR